MEKLFHIAKWENWDSIVEGIWVFYDVTFTPEGAAIYGLEKAAAVEIDFQKAEFRYAINPPQSGEFACLAIHKFGVIIHAQSK